MSSILVFLNLVPLVLTPKSRKDSTRKSLVLYNQVSHELALVNDPGEFRLYDDRFTAAPLRNNNLAPVNSTDIVTYYPGDELASSSLVTTSQPGFPAITAVGSAPNSISTSHSSYRSNALPYSTHNSSTIGSSSSPSSSSPTPPPYLSSNTTIRCPECGSFIRTHGLDTPHHQSQHLPSQSQGPSMQQQQQQGPRHRRGTGTSGLQRPRQIEFPIVRDANYFKLLEGFTPISDTITCNSSNNNNDIDLGEDQDHDDNRSRFESDGDKKNSNSNYDTFDTIQEPSTSNLNTETNGGNNGSYSSISASAFSQGYFDQFFKLKSKLGQGSRGAVYLVEHILDGYSLGLFALKKVPVGNDHKWLEKVLAEVHLLRLLSHPNLVNYNHMWLETSQMSRFSPVVPCAFILQEYCDGGTLEDYVKNLQTEAFQAAISAAAEQGGLDSESGSAFGDSSAKLSAARKRERFRRQSENRARNNIGQSMVMNEMKEQILRNACLTPEEILAFARDIFAGVAHLHQSQVIHRDLKPSNCLLLTAEKRSTNGGSGTSGLGSNDKGKGNSNDSNNGDSAEAQIKSRLSKLPTVLVSDFGEGQLEGLLRTGTGATGTLEYCAPELITLDTVENRRTGKLSQFSKKTDMFSLGMILHFLCFSRLPYSPRFVDGVDAESLDKLRQEVSEFKGFDITNVSIREDLPEEMYTFLARLLSITPTERPSAEEGLHIIENLMKDTIPPKTTRKNKKNGSTNEENETFHEKSEEDSKIGRSESPQDLVVAGYYDTEGYNNDDNDNNNNNDNNHNQQHASIQLISDISIEDAKSTNYYQVLPVARQLLAPPTMGGFETVESHGEQNENNKQRMNQKRKRGPYIESREFQQSEYINSENKMPYIIPFSEFDEDHEFEIINNSASSASETFSGDNNNNIKLNKDGKIFKIQEGFENSEEEIMETQLDVGELEERLLNKSQGSGYRDLAEDINSTYRNPMPPKTSNIIGYSTPIPGSGGSSSITVRSVSNDSIGGGVKGLNMNTNRNIILDKKLRQRQRHQEVIYNERNGKYSDQEEHENENEEDEDEDEDNGVITKMRRLRKRYSRSNNSNMTMKTNNNNTNNKKYFSSSAPPSSPTNKVSYKLILIKGLLFLIKVYTIRNMMMKKMNNSNSQIINNIDNDIDNINNDYFLIKNLIIIPTKNFGYLKEFLFILIGIEIPQ